MFSQTAAARRVSAASVSRSHMWTGGYELTVSDRWANQSLPGGFLDTILYLHAQHFKFHNNINKTCYRCWEMWRESVSLDWTWTSASHLVFGRTKTVSTMENSIKVKSNFALYFYIVLILTGSSKLLFGMLCVFFITLLDLRFGKQILN